MAEARQSSSMANLTDTEELADFLRIANQNIYANKQAQKVSPLRPQSEDYHFEQDDWAHHDTYFGERDFIGEEVVYKNQKPVWGMNYFGFIPDENANTEEVYDFLRNALMQEHSGIIPVRGPNNFSDGNKKYRFIINGGLANFLGEEVIIFDEKVVYRCFVHGGFIK